MAYVDATAMAFFLFSHNSKKLHHNIHIEKKMSLQEKKKWRRERENMQKWSSDAIRGGWGHFYCN